MKIIFRVDASISIGSGHVMRCLTLAIELQRRGARIAFICRELPGDLCDFIEAKDFRVHRHQSPWSDIDWYADAEQTAAILAEQGEKIDWLVVDHYGLDRKWEIHLRSRIRQIMVIDDLANRPHDCDLLLDQNLYQDSEIRYNNLIPSQCQKLFGPKYALLRLQFIEARRISRKRDGSVRRILIFFGGSDPTNETAKTIEAVRVLNRPDIAVDVVVGVGNPYKEQIKQLCTTLPNTTYHCQVANMAELMVNADLAIGAGGSATWERCCIGLPSIVIAIAHNQEETATAMAEDGRLLYLGRSSDLTVESLSRAIETLSCNSGLLMFFAKSSRELVDGRGVIRIANLIMPAGISLRPVIQADCEHVYFWRNSAETRKYAFNSSPISRQEHDRWFAETLSNPNRVLLIGEFTGEAIGVLRYDLSGECAKVSIYLVPGKQSRGYGSQLLRQGNLWLRRNYPEIQSVLAEVITGNKSSAKAFFEAEFEHQISIFRKKFNRESSV